MPRRIYYHNCLELDGQHLGLTERVCYQCGRIGEFGGWGWNVVEQFCRWSRRTGGLPPGGPRPPWLRDREVTRTCERCQGNGLLGQEIEETFPQECPDCQGAGGHPLLEPETIARVRAYALGGWNLMGARPWSGRTPTGGTRRSPP
jgi:hypothetical protein